VCDPDARLHALAEDAVGARGRAHGRERAGAAPGSIDEGEFEVLRAWRLERAAGSPAYTVASNAVLEEILRRRPRGPAELLEIRGVGRGFCANHGESLLATLARLGEGPRPSERHAA
jgi:superfamily II DNA helicase RecQ